MDSECTLSVPKLEKLLDQLRRGDSSARNELLEAAGQRLMTMTRRMKAGYPNVGRWEQTEDIFQNAVMRLHRALADVMPQDARHFYRLAALQIRRELLDLARHYARLGERYRSQPRDAENERAADVFEPLELSTTPENMMDWVEFHAGIEGLSEPEREVVELLWYHGLSQQEAADIIKVDVRTIKRRWRAARLALHDKLDGDSPAD